MDIEWPHEGAHADKGVVARFDAIGVWVARVRERLRVRMPIAAECERLELPRDLPVVVIDRDFRAGRDDDLHIEAAGIIYPSDRYEFTNHTEVK